MFLIPSLLMAFVYILSAMIKLHYKKYGDFFVRVLCFCFYTFVFIYPETSLVTLREWSRYLFFLLPIVEIVFWIETQFQRRKKG